MKYFLIAILFTLSIIANSQDAQFRGPMRNGMYPDTGLLKEWPASGPKLLLSVEGIGLGWGSAVLSSGIIYVTGMTDTTDYLSAISMDGNFIWKKPYGRSWTKSYPDTRVTPTIEENRIYVLSGTGRLVCFNAKDGSIIWAIEVDKDFESKWHSWGVSENILIVDNKVICTPGGNKTAVVAFDKLTGKLIWQSLPVNDLRSYVAPILYKYNNFRYILAETNKYLLALNPETGEIVWKYQINNNYKDKSTIPINSPIYRDDQIFISNGYDYPSEMLKLAEDGKSVSVKWIDHTLDNHHHGLILIGNYVYGSNWLSNTQGKWVCLNWETGEVQYVKDWFAKGPMISAENLLYVVDEKYGNVGLVEPTPEGFNIISSFKLKQGKGEFWAHPTIYDGKLFLRYNNTLMVYNIRK